MARPKRLRKELARYKPEPWGGGRNTKSYPGPATRTRTWASVAASKPDTQPEVKPAIKPGSVLKKEPATSLITDLIERTESGSATTFSSKIDSPHPSFAQYEPRIVQQTGLYLNDVQERLEGM